MNIPVIHLLTQYRDVAEIASNPFWRTRAEDPAATRKNVLRHNLAGMPGVAIIPELYDRQRDFVVDTKKRYDCFLGTDLEFTLRAHGINTLLITGVNTNSCVLATTTAANVRDYAVIVVKDCVETMDGAALHEAGLPASRPHSVSYSIRPRSFHSASSRRRARAPPRRLQCSRARNDTN